MAERDKQTGQFVPGKSGNASGRPKGSRNKLGEEFVTALHDDFQEHGAEVIAQVRQERPHEYLKVIAGILPRELKVQSSTSDLTDEELNQRIMQIAGVLGLETAATGETEQEQTRSPGVTH